MQCRYQCWYILEHRRQLLLAPQFTNSRGMDDDTQLNQAFPFSIRRCSGFVAPWKSELSPRSIRLDVFLLTDIRLDIWCRALDGKSVKEIKLNPLKITTNYTWVVIQSLTTVAVNTCAEISHKSHPRKKGQERWSNQTVVYDQTLQQAVQGRSDLGSRPRPHSRCHRKLVSSASAARAVSTAPERSHVSRFDPACSSWHFPQRLCRIGRNWQEHRVPSSRSSRVPTLFLV